MRNSDFAYEHRLPLRLLMERNTLKTFDKINEKQWRNVFITQSREVKILIILAFKYYNIINLSFHLIYYVSIFKR